MTEPWIEILQTDLHTFPKKISLENLIKDLINYIPSGDHFKNSHNLFSWCSMSIVKRKLMLLSRGFKWLIDFDLLKKFMTAHYEVNRQ